MDAISEADHMFCIKKSGSVKLLLVTMDDNVVEFNVGYL